MISVKHLSTQAGKFELRDISFEIPAGAYGVLMGATGCGKSTLLECICGLKPINSGSIELGGVDVTHALPGDRGIGYVPQDGALFNQMIVRENLSFSLDIRKAPAAFISQRVDELSDLLGLRHLLERTTYGLSGGERQRIALGRALAFQPSILLVDEPLSAVDEAMREDICNLLKKIRQTTSVTVMHVTHSHQEAKTLADILFVLENGQVTVHPDYRTASKTQTRKEDLHAHPSKA